MIETACRMRFVMLTPSDSSANDNTGHAMILPKAWFLQNLVNRQKLHESP
jgi:hypothetical protein